LDDLESFPDDIAESFDDFQLKVDSITEEFLNLLLKETRNTDDFIVDRNKIDEEDFRGMFPYLDDVMDSA
jgi:hypothetical protein